MDSYVLIPSRNIDQLLLKTIESIKKSRESLEIVIGFDNGYIDQAVASRLKDLGVEVYKSPAQTPSVHSALNFALKTLSKNQPIFRIDSDDLWMKGRAKLQSNISGSYDAVASNVAFINSVGLPFPNLKYSFESGRLRFPILLFSNVISHPTIYFTNKGARDLVYPDNAAEDYALWLDWIVKGRTIYYCKNKVVKYRMHQNQVSRNFSRSESQLTELYAFWIKAADTLKTESMTFENFVALQCREYGCTIHGRSSSHVIGFCIRLLKFYDDDCRTCKSYRNRLIQELFIWSIFHNKVMATILELHEARIPITASCRILSRTFLHGVFVSIFVKRK
jgi:glycosyltransferase involved in cell wall biosynthesis